MKILYTIHQFFPRHYTGTERYLLNLAKMMQRLGHEVLIVTYAPVNDPMYKWNEYDGYASCSYIYENLPVIAVRYRGDESYISFDFENKVIEKFFTQLIKKENPDIVHITHPMRMTSAFFAAQKLRKKIVMTLTDYWVMCGKGTLLRNNDSPCTSPRNGENCKKYCYQHLPLGRLADRVETGRKMFRRADALIASAEFLVQLYRDNEYDVSKLHVIRHGYNYFDGFQPISKKKHKNFTISTLGSLLPHKGAQLLIEAFKKIPFEDMRLRIYGEAYLPSFGEYLEKLKGNDDRISFAGKYTMAQTPGIHEESDVIVQPSLWFETYPLTGVAALAYGVPLIVPDATGASELVQEGQNGFLFEFGDANSLAIALQKAYHTRLKQTKTIFYPYTIESEAFSTQAMYQDIVE